MTTNKFSKILFAAAFALCFGLSANAQLGGLLNKAKNAAKNKVENAIKNEADKQVDNAVSSAKKEVNKNVEYKTQLNAPQVTKDSDIDDIYSALDYWLDLQEMANNKKDIEWLCSAKGDKSTEIINIILNHGSKDVARFHSFEKEKTRYEEVAKVTNQILNDGKPEIKDEASLAETMKWFYEKAKKGKQNAKNYYTVNGAAYRYLCFSSGRYKDTPEIQKINKEFIKLWNEKVDADYKAKYPNCDPNMTYEQIQEKVAAEKKASEERKAAAAAKKKADIEASKQTLKAGSMNKSLNAKVLKLAKEVKPNVTKVVIENSSWTIDRNAFGTILRRKVLAWLVYTNDEGYEVANDHCFAEEYMGGGKYGSLKHYSVGVRTVYVK